jgi:cell shape-determining protein MreC
LILFISFCAFYAIDWLFLIVDSEYGCIAVSSIIALYYNLSVSIVDIVIPFLFTFLINILTFLQLRKKQINRNSFKRAKKLFKISLGLDFLFLISNAPVFMIYLISNLFALNNQFPVIDF